VETLLSPDPNWRAGEVSLRVAQYVRMSTEHQRYSTENQADTIAQYAVRYGFEIVRTYADHGKSGLRICYLLEHGENRLLVAVERGVMPPNIAIEIARASESEVQQALAEAYEKKALPGNQVLAIRRIIQQRNQLGKGGRSATPRAGGSGKVTAAALIQSYQKEAQRQKVLVKKADLTQSRLIFVVNAVRSLFDDDNFVTLLRAEGMHTLPRPLAAQLDLVEV
jgi:methionine aminopeptidase